MIRPKLPAAATMILAAAAPAQIPVSATPPVAMLVSWDAGVARCRDRAVEAVRAPRPLSGAAYIYDDGRPRGPAMFGFSVDASGRPTAIRALHNPYNLDSADLGPALAASRFAAGAPRDGCVIAFTPTWTPFDRASREAVIGYTLLPVTDPPRAAWRRLRPANGTCHEPRPSALVSVSPDYAKLPQPPGTVAWTMIGFDTDRRGRPLRARVAASSGDAALDRAGLKALKRSRFAGGERRGCLFPYVRRGDPLPAPDAPEPASLRPAHAACPDEVPGMNRPAHDYPEAYRRRGIEGWAVIGYDVAPWGEVGNARVLAAEPAAEFGTTALGLVTGVRLPASSRGHSGCVQRVRFDLPGGGPPDRTETGADALAVTTH